MLVSMTTTLWTCSINPFDKSSTKCTEDRCYRWDIWGSPNACKSCAATFLQIPVMHFFSALSQVFVPNARRKRNQVGNIQVIFAKWPQHFVRHCVKLSLEWDSRDHLFCNFKAKSCPQEFPLPLKRPSGPS